MTRAPRLATAARDGGTPRSPSRPSVAAEQPTLSPAAPPLCSYEVEDTTQLPALLPPDHQTCELGVDTSHWPQAAEAAGASPTAELGDLPRKSGFTPPPPHQRHPTPPHQCHPLPPHLGTGLYPPPRNGAATVGAVPSHCAYTAPFSYYDKPAPRAPNCAQFHALPPLGPPQPYHGHVRQGWQPPLAPPPPPHWQQPPQPPPWQQAGGR